jgi:hypothetical protein
VPIQFVGVLGTAEGYCLVFDLLQGRIEGAGTAPTVMWILELVWRICQSSAF